jgi:hypothetical protein
MVEQAIVDLEAIHESNPESLRSLHSLALSYVQAGRTSELTTLLAAARDTMPAELTAITVIQAECLLMTGGNRALEALQLLDSLDGDGAIDPRLQTTIRSLAKMARSNLRQRIRLNL